MIGFLARWVAKISGPALVYVLIGLIVSNAATGYLLKRAWVKNAQAVLQCENRALRDANDANALVTAELKKLQGEHDIYREAVRVATAEVEKKVEDQQRELEIEHEIALAELEVVTNEIPDEDYYCASEPVSIGPLLRMRDAVAAYNKNRIGNSH